MRDQVKPLRSGKKCSHGYEPGVCGHCGKHSGPDEGYCSECDRDAVEACLLQHQFPNKGGRSTGFLASLDREKLLAALNRLSSPANALNLREMVGALFLDTFVVPDDATRQRLVAIVLKTILRRLAQQYPKDAKSASEFQLLSRYPVDALALLNQVHIQAMSWWEHELYSPSPGSSEETSERFLLFLSDPPALSGKPALGGMYQHVYLAEFDYAMGLLGSGRTSNFSKGALETLFPGVSKQKLNQLETRKRTWLALEHVSRTITPHRSRNHIHKLLSGVRKRRVALEKAIWPEGSRSI